MDTAGKYIAQFPMTVEFNLMFSSSPFPQRMPTALSLLKNRIKKNHTVSTDPNKKYRGMTVTKPMLNFSGEYTCSVQTYQSSDKKSSFLQIIGEPKRMPCERIPKIPLLKFCRAIIDKFSIITN